MAVYKHRYNQYEGELTPEWRRFLVLPRYVYRRVFQSRFFTIFFFTCFIVPLAGAVIIYLRYNLSALEMLRIPPEVLVGIDAAFFLRLLEIQGVFAFLVTVYVGPGLVSPDLAHNALPLYLSRPFSKVDYVLGKLSVLLILLSLVTWVPLSSLFLLQASLAEAGWALENVWILPALVVGSLIWVLFLSVLALAISAWVRWKPVAGALLFGVFFVCAGFGEAINGMLLTNWGDLFNLSHVIRVIWESMFLVQDAGASRSDFYSEGIPIWSAWGSLCALSGCCLLLLFRKVRAYEVVK